MKHIALALTLALTACAGRVHITPGLTLKCDGHCRVYPANVGQGPEPGQRMWERVNPL